MGTSNQIQDINLNILGLECSQCQQSFTNQDKINHNWEFWFDTTGNDNQCLKIGGWWRLSVWVREISHKDCPETKEEVDHA